VNQQINLYQPIFRRERRVFSAVTILQALGLVLVGLALVYAYGLIKLRALEQDLDELRAREQASLARVERLSAELPPGSMVATAEQRLAELRATLDTRRRTLSLMQSGALGSTEGFSAQLAALAANPRGELWLTGISINRGGAYVALTGYTYQPEQVASFLRGLSEAPVFSGVRFAEFEMQRDDEGPFAGAVSFRVASRLPDEDANTGDLGP
jgi:hypothetical protein